MFQARVDQLARCHLPGERRKDVHDGERKSDAKQAPEHIPHYVSNMFVPPCLVSLRAKSWREEIAPTANDRLKPGSDLCKCACDAHDYLRCDREMSYVKTTARTMAAPTSA